MQNIKKRTGAVAATVVGLVGVSVAYAAWTSTGTGSGDINAGTARNLTVAVSSTSALYPTGTAPVSFTVTNPNPYAVTLTGANVVGAVTVDGQHSACNVASVSGSPVTLSERIAANATGVAHSLDLAMSNSANDNCQGATFTVTVRVDAASSN